MPNKSTMRANSEWLNVWMNFNDRRFAHLYKGKEWGEGRIVRGVNSELVEAEYTHHGEENELPVMFKVVNLDYDPITRSGFIWGPMQHDFSELPPVKQG